MSASARIDLLCLFICHPFHLCRIHFQRRSLEIFWSAVPELVEVLGNISLRPSSLPNQQSGQYRRSPRSCPVIYPRAACPNNMHALCSTVHLLSSRSTANASPPVHVITCRDSTRPQPVTRRKRANSSSRRMLSRLHRSLVFALLSRVACVNWVTLAGTWPHGNSNRILGSAR
jgi:hypothetical protein